MEVDGELEKEAKRAVDYLERMRVEHGCETALHLVSDAAFLVSGMHDAVHRPEPTKEVQAEMRGLAATLFKTAATTSLDASWQLVAAWKLVLLLRCQIKESSPQQQPPVDKKIEVPEEKTPGTCVTTLSPDPLLVAAIQGKYPAAEVSRQLMYAQYLTALKRETKTEAFSELEQMVPQSYVDNLLA